MKLLTLAITLMISTQAFATGDFECISKNGKTSVSGVVGAGSIPLNDIHVYHEGLSQPLPLALSMKWIDYDREEIKIKSYDVINDIHLLTLKVENGHGTLDLNLPEVLKGNDLIASGLKVNCEFE